MNFRSEVKNLGRNWEAETGTVATTDLGKFLRSEFVAKIMKFIGCELLDVTKIHILELDHFEQHSPRYSKFFKGWSWENTH